MSGYHLFDVTNSLDHELLPGKTVIGRGADCDIRLLSTNVSRRHGQFELAGNTLSYTDLGSSNGSFINGQAVTTSLKLRNGDELVIGELHFTIQHSEEAAAGAHETDDATELMAGGASAIPGTWSESAGLEQASGTQLGHFAKAGENEGAEAYRAGTLALPALGDTPRLVGLNGELLGHVFALTSPHREDPRGTWKLGRDTGSVDVVINHVSVSGQHAQIVNEGPRWKIVNWMSTNGTFVNGQKGLSTYLKSGDVIGVGSVELAFELPETSAAGTRRKSVVHSPPQAGKGGFSGLLKRLFGGK